jgi:hypothetical protein
MRVTLVASASIVLLGAGLMVPSAVAAARPGVAATDSACSVGSPLPGNAGCQVSFSFTGGPQSFTVPEGVSGNLNVDLAGAAGGNGGCGASNGGRGGGVSGLIRAIPGQVFEVNLGATGGAGENAACDGSTKGGSGGAGGGGDAGGGVASFNANAGGGGGRSTLSSTSGVELVAGGGGGGGSLGQGGAGGGGDSVVEMQDGSPGKDNNSQPGTPAGSTAGTGGGGGTATAAGAGGMAGIDNVPPPPPRQPDGTPGAGGVGSDGGSGTTYSSDPDPGDVAFIENSGGGGGGLFGGGSGGCGYWGCGGGGGGSSFAATNVQAASFGNDFGQSTGPKFPASVNGEAIIDYSPPCAAPLDIKTGTAKRDPDSGLLKISLDGTVNPIATCGKPSLLVEDDATGEAHRSVDLAVEVIGEVTAHAARTLDAHDSCWIGGKLKLSQGTGTAKREATQGVEVKSKLDVTTAKAERKPDGVSVEIKVIGLPPPGCGHARIKLDGESFERLKNVHLEESGGTVTARATREPIKADCHAKGSEKVTFEVLPPKGDGGAAKATREVTGADNVVKICQK